MVDDPKWNGQEGRGGITWDERSRMGRLRGVLDAADVTGRRNRYLHQLHTYVLRRALRSARRRFFRALDFGCGTGRFLRLLAEYSQETYGIDREKSMVEAARTFNEELASTILWTPAGVLPFPDEHFDLALTFSVLSAIPKKSVEPCVAELARVCAPNATYMLCEKIRHDDNLTPDFYHDVFKRAGFRALKVYPVRSAASPFSRIAAQPSLDEPLITWLAVLEAHVTSLVHRRTEPNSYTEYFFVCEKT